MIRIELTTQVGNQDHSQGESIMRQATLLCALAIAIFVTPAIVFASDIPAPDWQALIVTAVEAVQAGHWWVLAAAIVSGLVWVVRRWGCSLWPWLGTDRGGAVLVLVTAVLGSLAGLILAGDAAGLDLLMTGLQTGFTAAGGYTIIRRIVGAPTEE